MILRLRKTRGFGLAEQFECLPQNGSFNLRFLVALLRLLHEVWHSPLEAFEIGKHQLGLHRLRVGDRIDAALDMSPGVGGCGSAMPYNFACVLAVSAGDIEGALDMIEPLMPRQSRSLMLTMLADPDMDPLRDHPRFKRMRLVWSGTGTGRPHTAMYIQGVDNVFALKFNDAGVTYGDVFLENEVEMSAYNFEVANTDTLFDAFRKAAAECESCLANKLPIPAYEQAIKASHVFNTLQARGVISVAERQAYIGRVRDLAKAACAEWLERGQGA